MGHFIKQAFSAVLSSAFLPARFRRAIMQRAGFKLANDTCIWSGATILSNKMSTGKEVFINVGFFYDGFAELRIGNNVRMGQFVRMVTATHDIGPPEQRCTIEPVGGPIVIGDGCWIGTGAVILPCVTVAPGCVIAAGAVVTKSTQSNGLYAGTPAKLIRALPS